MAKSSIRRDRKYRRKFDEDHVAKQLALAKEDMQNQYAQTQAELEKYDNATREVLAELGIPTIQYISYLNFVRQIWKLHRNFMGKTVEDEVKVIYDKWAARKLDTKVLERVAQSDLRGQ